MQLSVHLQNLPALKDININKSIVKKMDEVREICNCVFSLRKDANIRVRMPLKKITICGYSNLEDEYLELIKQEVNTKEIEIFNNNLDEIATKEIILNMKECGKTFGSNLKKILIAQKNGNWKIENDKLKIDNFELDKELYQVVYKSKNGKKTISCSNFNLLVMIDETQDDELIVEGLSRDLIRMIQQERKNKNLEINNKINIVINTNDDIINRIMLKWKDYICEQTLAENIVLKNNIDYNKIIEIDNFKFSFDITKVI